MATTIPGTRRFFGRFEILRELGAGGMGAVYQVHDPATDRQVALKVLGLPLAAFAEEQRRELLRRFEREARVASALVHPGIARVLEAGESEGAPWIAMELVRGETLAEVMKREGRPFRARGAAFVAEVALAIHAAHEAGFVHRDLKPANVMVEESTGRARVLDFGLAREISPGSRLTKDGQALGTPEYMAPEQARGEIEAIDARTDVYGLGAILYEVLTGSPPFTGSAPWKVAVSVLQDEVRRPRDLDPTVPAALERVCLRALSRDRLSRHATAADFAEDLRGALALGDLAHGRSLVPAALVLLGFASLVPLGVAASRRTAPAAPVTTASTVALEASAAVVSSAARAQAERLSESSYVKLTQHDPDAALADAERALETDPSLSSAWTNRGMARAEKGDLDGADADCTRSIELNPDRSIAWNNRGNVRHKRGELKAALADFDRAIALDPLRTKAWNNRGLVRWKMGDHEGAVADLTSAIGVNPRDSKAWSNRGLVHAEMRLYDAAIEDFLQVTRLQPKDGRPWSNMGNTKFDRGDNEGAIKDCSMSIELDPGYAAAWWGRGAARAATGDRRGAIADLERYLELDPNGKASQQARQKIAELKRQP